MIVSHFTRTAKRGSARGLNGLKNRAWQKNAFPPQKMKLQRRRNYSLNALSIFLLSLTMCYTSTHHFPPLSLLPCLLWTEVEKCTGGPNLPQFVLFSGTEEEETALETTKCTIKRNHIHAGSFWVFRCCWKHLLVQFWVAISRRRAHVAGGDRMYNVWRRENFSIWRRKKIRNHFGFLYENIFHYFLGRCAR